MTSMLINMFGMREDIQAYHLGGMGCSMGVVGLNLVRDLLAVSHEGWLGAEAELACVGVCKAQVKLCRCAGRHEGRLLLSLPAPTSPCSHPPTIPLLPPPPLTTTATWQAHPNKNVLFVCNEVVTAGFYLGGRKEGLVTNALFRMGGAAAILSNR
jgi:predicted naringenin-chalcone synthase